MFHNQRENTDNRFVEQSQQLLLGNIPHGLKAMDNDPHASNSNVQTFLKALTDFETSLAAPVVSGELIDRAANALQACEEAKTLLLGAVQKTHARLFKSIERDNLDLASQVERLRATDARVG